jgi:hypothetical protein
MSNISVTTTQSVIAVTQTGGITVTTPEGQTIAVTVPNSSVNVTNTTDDITITEVGITNTDQLIEGTTNLFFTNARARSAISLTTDDSSILAYNSTTGVFTWNTPTTTKINEGTNLYYTTARANTDFDTRLATKTTTNLAEGANLYYTTARANTDFDTRLATKSTTNLAEGTNQYFTTARARQSLSAGTGISYDNVTGVITNTSINTDTTYTIDASTATGGANLNLVGSDATTDTVKIASGTNTTVSRTDANTITIASTDTNTTYTQNASAATGGANLNLVGSDSTTDTIKFAEGTGITVVRTDADTITITNTVPDTNTTYTQNFSATSGGANLNLVGSDSTTDTVKFANGTGVTITRTDADTATIAIGQPVATTDNVQFNDITLTGNIIDTGALQISTGSNGNLTLAPNGTGSVVSTFSNGGNLTNNRNYVAGAIRNSTTASIGDIWAVNSTGPSNPFRGISIDNSADTTRGPGAVLRSYGTGAGLRGRLVFEKARGTAASPAALQVGDFLGSIDATGYTSTGWLNDNVAAVVPAFFGFTATENWVSNTNLGTAFGLSQAPIATTITSAANLIQTLTIQPESAKLSVDRFSIGQGKTVGFTATGCSTSGTTLTIGTLTSGTIAVGQVLTSTTAINGHYIIANISGSGSGSTWTMGGSPGTFSAQALSGSAGFLGSVPATSTTTDILQDLRLVRNTIKGSTGTTQIVTSSAGATLALAGDTITLENAAGTDYAVLNSTSATFTQPVGLPVKTAAAWNAITGAVGQMVCVSNSAGGAHPNGMMAFWDTTNARWSYIHDNSAV